MKEYISLKELEALATLCTHAVRELNPEDSFVHAVDTFMLHIKNWHKVNKEYNAVNKIREAYKLLQNKELTEDDFFVFFEKYLMEQKNFNTDVYDISRDKQSNTETLTSVILNNRQADTKRKNK
jgi:hypothetical protein